jgi:flagellar basal body-associated protein FliL
MKTLGTILIVVGVLALLIGLFACFATLTSTYASSACEKAATDKGAFDKARATCGSTASPCYKQMTIGLTSEEECESKKSFMRNQLIMSIVPVVVGILLAVVGFFLRRRKVAVA